MKALDAANYLVYLMTDVCEDLTNMKLNKLLYYAQGHYLQKYGVALFDDDIEAWEHGPVVREVYNQYKRFDNSPVTGCDESRLANVSETASDVLFEVAREYGKYTASALRNMTHVRNGPWDKAYKPSKRGEVIPERSIQEYFSRPGAKELCAAELTFTEDDFIGYRDSDGILVLPKEWDDEEV